MYVPRKIDRVLADWALEPDRKPLVLRGARQTGKSSSVRELGRGFELFLELNLERQEDLALVRACRSAAELLAALAARANVAAFPERTLLFLDEIQESPEAIGWLRFLREDYPSLHVVAAGSLLEVRLEDRGLSFPVGRVTFRTLRPLSFAEFLDATGKDVLASRLRNGLTSADGIAPALHDQALGLLRDYLWVGGMPEAVVRWADTASVAAVRQVHSDLAQALAEDVQKYGRGDVAEIEAAFANLKHHYGLRFRYDGFAPGYRTRPMKVAIGKLEGAMLITRVQPTSSLRLPLEVRPRMAPKLLPLDVGLAGYAMGAGVQDLRALPIDRLFDGRLAEMFAGQQLLTSFDDATQPLCFWVTESPSGNAETDYLLPGPAGPVPVEVKAGAAGALKSLHQFLRRAGLDFAIRLGRGGLADESLAVSTPEGTLCYRLLSLPLYLAEEAPATIRRLAAHSPPATPARIRATNTA